MLTQKFIDKFTRWMVKKEAANRAAKRPGYCQEHELHNCNTPACIGGYLNAYPPFRKLHGARASYFRIEYTGCRSNLDETKGSGALASARYDDIFGSWLQFKTALQAANNMRKFAGLPRLTRADLE